METTGVIEEDGKRQEAKATELDRTGEKEIKGRKRQSGHVEKQKSVGGGGDARRERQDTQSNPSK